MGYLRIKANECNYKENGRRLKEQFINCRKVVNTMTEIILEFTKVKKTNEINSEQVLAWTRRVEAQTAQKAFMEMTKRQ